MNNKNMGMFLIENKELTVNALNHVEKALKLSLNNMILINDNKINKDFDSSKSCKETIELLAFLIKTLDHKDKITKLSKDLDYLYKHCIFSLIRVRDHNDYEFLNSSIKVLSEIAEGWERVTAAVVNNQQN